MLEEETAHIPTSDDLKIVSRLVLNKVLSCEGVKYLSRKSIEKVRQMMLSSEPDREVVISFTENEDARNTSHHYYTSTSCEMMIQWLLDPSEIIDESGNVWQSYRLNLSCSVASAYSLDARQLAKKSELIASVSQLVCDILNMIPDALRIRAYDDAGRRDRDEKRRIESVAESCIKIFSREQKGLRTGLRVNGKPRSFKRDLVLPNVLPGIYKFEINDGSRWSTKGIKKYTVCIPSSIDYLATIKRTT